MSEKIHHFQSSSHTHWIDQLKWSLAKYSPWAKSDSLFISYIGCETAAPFIHVWRRPLVAETEITEPAQWKQFLFCPLIKKAFPQISGWEHCLMHQEYSLHFL